MEQILIVEDDTDINNMMASALTKAGYECKQSFSGTETSLDKGTQRKTTENELPSLTQCTA